MRSSTARASRCRRWPGRGRPPPSCCFARALMDRSPQARIVYTAFNASIVADARRGRFGRNVTASTMHSLARQALLQTGYADKVEHADKGARWPEQWAEVLGIPEATAAETRDGAVPADAVEVARLVIATVRKFRESADDEPGRQHLPLPRRPAGSPLSEAVLSYARKAWADISDTRATPGCWPPAGRCASSMTTTSRSGRCPGPGSTPRSSSSTRPRT